MMKRKVLAALAAVVLGVGTMPTGVLAAESYKETEKEVFKKTVESLAESYGKGLENYKSALPASGIDITASLDEAGRAILGMLAPADISWLQDAKISTDVSLTDSNMSQIMNFSVNGTKICSLEYYMDIETLDVYMKIPELADGYIKVNIEENLDAVEQGTDTLEKSVEDNTSVSVPAESGVENAAQLLKSIGDLEEKLPEVESVKALMDQYGTIFLDGINDGESAVETITAGGIEQECTAMEGSMTAKEIVSVSQEILSIAKDDEELKSLIESWTKDMDDETYSYESFVQSIENAEENLASAEETGNGSILSKIWIDEDGNVAGRQISITDEAGTAEPLIAWKSPKADNQCGLSLELYSDGSTISLEGSGELTGDLLNGTYTLSMDDMAFTVDVKDYDTAAMKDGNLNGSYTFSVVPSQTEDKEYTPLEGFELVAEFMGDDETGSVTLSLNSSGAGLVSIGLTARPGEQVEYVDVSSMDKIYDIESEADGDAFMNDMSLDTIMDNLMAAGMPEGFIEDLMSSGEDTDSYTDNSYLDEEDTQN